ncbi:MAG: glycerol-3-phosphate dehydrogenase/oxidase [Verrucomicrobia bacterium]|nr:glycerol-3-phosphate dehydrogenase/oxidase [Verrucomicrobiota bacterium]
MQRDSGLDQIRSRDETWDVLIVGGGATGLGAAVDAATRGHKVALIERADFAKGTSSRSTKLVHGGVRYLKQGNISLVMEALRERGRLHRNAPHLVHSLPFVIPNYHWWEGPFYGIGMKAYDQLAGELGLAPSRWLSREETVWQIPTIEQEHLTGGVIYHDGQFDDARLAVTLAQSAIDHGAVVLNYVECAGLIKEHDKICGALVRDGESGAEFEIRARCVINATGVFVDALRQMDEAQAKGVVAASQGVHIVLPREFLPGNSAIMIPKTEDGRVLFAVPWHGRVVVGTTDTPCDDVSMEPRALPEEREFLMQHAARYLTRDPQPSDVLSIYAGLRPLVKRGDAKNTAVLSRDHTILISDSSLLTITGGKWTTYRKMAEDVVNRAEEIAGIEKHLCGTESLRLHGAMEVSALSASWNVYGTDAAGVAEIARESAALAERIHPRLEYQKAEVVWHVRHEMARTVEDVLARRTRALFLDAKAAMEAAPAVAEIMARELGRDEAWARKSVEEFMSVAAGYVY